MANPVNGVNLGLPPAQFYGCNVSSVKKRVKQVSSEVPVHTNIALGVGLNMKPLPFNLNCLKGPSQTWKIFKKQNDALTCAKMRKNGLMTFAFQQSTGDRLFLVAHPQVFWHYDCRRIMKHRCTYEIIPEYSVSKLYFDLEYEIAYNQNCIGNEMVETFIRVISYYIKKVFGIECNRKHVLDLDSTTNVKFSRHLIFQLPMAVFRNNFHIGNFVKYVCNEIKSSCNVTDIPANNDIRPCANNILSKCELVTNVSSLIVSDRNGRLKLFCDEAVYTKNRHFRLFQSTKYGQNAPLLISTQNMFYPSGGDSNVDETIFLNSLVTFVATESDANFRILEFCTTPASNNQTRYIATPNEVVSNSVQPISSPYPFVDNFVQKLVSPGHIWRSAFFTTSDVIVYDIVGNRYCGNIGREHRSNNVKYIVDIKECCYYQKCHDPDCFKYRSRTIKLPPELCFLLEDDSDFTEDYNLTNFQGHFDIPDEDLLEVLNVIEDVSNLDFENDKMEF